MRATNDGGNNVLAEIMARAVIGGIQLHVGHMTPNEVINRQFGRLAQMETFLMSNMSPQYGSLNVGVWLKLEDAIREMTIADAFEILRGPDNAATLYFREKTAGPLEARFAPVVTAAMKEVGLYAQYQKLLDRYALVPFSKPMPPSLESYVTQKTLDGLFSVLADEEAKIREDPAARTTELLQKVFGPQT